MDDKSKTKVQLIQELTALRQQVNELSQADMRRRQAESELLEREHKYRTLIEFTQDLIFTVDRKGLFTYVNPEFETATGYMASELMGSPFTNIIDPESWENVFNKFKMGMRGERSLPYEVHVVHKNGKRIPVEFLVTTLCDKNANAIGRYGIGRDITNRIEAEKLLRESEQKLYSVMQGSPTPAFVIGTDHKIIYWNEALAKLSNIQAVDVIGTSQQWRAFYSSERPCLADLLLDGNINEISERYRGKYSKSNLIDSAYEATDFFPHLGAKGRWLRFTGANIRDLEGTLVGALETLEDISDRKQAEESLQAAEALYRTLAERSFAGVYMVQDGKFRFINNNAASYAGYTREELLGQTAELLIGTIDREMAKKSARAMLKGELTVPYEFRIITKQGETRWIMETITSIFYEGKPAILGNSMDITERKQAEEALLRSEERYRTIIEGIEDGYFEVDIKGSMTFCNPSTARILGYTQEELIGMNNRQYIDGENARKVFSVFKAVYGTGLPARNFDWELIRKGGEKIFVETSVSLIRDVEGKPVGFRGIFRDITERKRMEEEIREMSHRDQLTELYNRRGFIALAEQQLMAANRAKRHMMLAFIDIDGMKWINDTLGHEEGDKALIDTATILRQTFRESDIIARIGGDEFAVLAIDMTDLNPEVLSKRFQQNMDDWNANESRPYTLAISWGTAIYDPESPMSLDQLMSLSDELMYLQKRAKMSRRT